MSQEFAKHGKALPAPSVYHESTDQLSERTMYKWLSSCLKGLCTSGWAGHDGHCIQHSWATPSVACDQFRDYWWAAEARLQAVIKSYYLYNQHSNHNHNNNGCFCGTLSHAKSSAQCTIQNNATKKVIVSLCLGLVGAEAMLQQPRQWQRPQPFHKAQQAVVCLPGVQ